jgi:hypothetical protein
LATDLALLKKTVISLSSKASLQDEKLAALELEVEHLKRENLKLTTDVKLIRNEQMEQINQVFVLERRAKDLQIENEALKRAR